MKNRYDARIRISTERWPTDLSTRIVCSSFTIIAEDSYFRCVFALEAFVLRQQFKTLLVLAGLVIAPNLALAEVVSVVLDQAKLMRLPERVSTIIIGNPSIADGTLQSGGLLVVTGKGYGTTNMMILDSKGTVIAEHTITVSAPNNGITVFRGADRETLSCAPNCQRTLVLGDSPAVFDAVATQNSQRNGISAGSPQGNAPAR